MRIRRAMLGAWGAALIVVAFAIRQPPPLLARPLPSSSSSATTLAELRASLSRETSRLEEIAIAALGAPAEAPDAFAFLARLPDEDAGEAVVLMDSSAAVAWAGQLRTTPDASTPPLSASVGPFFTTLSVARVRGQRRAVASAVIFAEPPADRLTGFLTLRLDRESTATFKFSVIAGDTAGSTSAAAQPVLSIEGKPALFATVIPQSPDEMKFESAARLRVEWGAILLAGYLLFLIVGWRDRRNLQVRLFTLAVGLIITGILPWSEFSNTSRAFDPGFYFSRVGGPYTANAAALLSTVSLLLLAVFAVIRARPRPRLSPAAAAAGCLLCLAAGLPLASNIVRGAGQPAWGTTPGLWLSWELPVFLFLFTVLVAAASLARAALRKSGTLSVRAVGIAALLAAVIATAALWVTTTHQRFRLAERDVAGLTRVDESEAILVRRFVDALVKSPPLVEPAGLLRLYASSELAAAELPVVLETRSSAGRLIATLDMAPGATDTSVMARAAAGAPGPVSVTTILGPTGVQTLGVVRYSTGETTIAVVLPNTRLVSPSAFASLIGIKRIVAGDPPYTVTLADVRGGIIPNANTVEWTRIGDHWHGDRLIPTSAGTRRGHVEVELRSAAARGERAILIVLLDVLLAGLLWLVGAAAERPFGRWLRVRALRWSRSYRARLTLALFTFFVVPALAFAVWSYGRLRSDDRQTRELLVNETLQSVAGSEMGEDLAAAGRRFDTPLFRYGGGFLNGASDSLYAELAPGGRALPPPVQLEIGGRGELKASWQSEIAGAATLLGYRAVLGPNEERYVLAAPARGDDLVLDRRRRDLGILVLFATSVGAVAALWLSGIAAKRLARDLELSRIEVARAERILAWGEMARQVAHEIKNPLTPIRLGVQHLRRARADKRADFDLVLDENVGRILSEIDRLDAIARSFSRYGSAPSDLAPAERIDVASVVRDVVALEQMGKGDVRWKLRGGDEPLTAMARRDELREVLLNVLENARHAAARRVDISLREEERRVTIEICDDGTGIAAAVLPRVFEPHFSTRTTGSGMGLPASRRIIEHWGGEIVVASEEGKGARVLIALVRPVS